MEHMVQVHKNNVTNSAECAVETVTVSPGLFPHFNSSPESWWSQRPKTSVGVDTTCKPETETQPQVVTAWRPWALVELAAVTLVQGISPVS